ncbi:MAG TPA: lytic murein transglycosylase [Thermoleophilaceae bacterium]|nr:lytic murein transglycosylase [Thermoleophilaceae bacterium]
MKKRLWHTLLCAGVALTAALTGFTVAASAETRVLTVTLVSGEVVTITVDVPPGTPVSAIQLPADIGPVQSVTQQEVAPAATTTETTPPPPPPTATTPPPPPAPTTPAPETTPAPPTTPPPPAPGPLETDPADSAPTPSAGRKQKSGGDDRRQVKRPTSKKAQPSPEGEGNGGGAQAEPPALRNPDGSPSVSNPAFFDALPGPSVAQGVPNFVIRKFRVPLFLLPIYQAAGIEYGIRWEILAAINEIETDYGRNLNVSSAGALGWMQFMPPSWRAYGVDANKDGRKDPYNPVDAIFAAARYLKAANYENDVRGAIFAYNHADWYVDSVLLRARLISGVPADLVGSLTGLTEGRFPVAARARYADDIAEREAVKRVQAGENAANVVESQDDRRSLEIFAQKGSPVVATNDGVIKKVGESPRLGNYVVLQDVYGNRYTYAGLGEIAEHYPVLKEDATDVRAIKANGDAVDPEPTKAASAGRQAASDDATDDEVAASAVEPTASLPFKERLFAHPNAEGARESGGLEQLLAAKARLNGKFETYSNYFSRPFGADAKDVRLRRLKVGSRVIGGTILGRIGKVDPAKAAHLDFGIRPAGRGAPSIDPKPILDGWKLLEATAIYRAAGKNVLYGRDARAGSLSIGQILLLPKPLLEKRVLADERIEIYEGGRSDIQSGQVDRRVLATLAYLAESGLRPTVTSLKSGHSFLTASGNVSHHSSGNAVDVAEINGVPILGHQEPGGVTDQAVRRLMRLQGTMRPDQIISLLDYGQNTIAMGDHHDHIHVGFQPLFGQNRRLGQQALAVLEPGQWSDLIARLREIDNPVVPTEPSKYSLPADKPASHAHGGE